jgi:hypothetical protein
VTEHDPGEPNDAMLEALWARVVEAWDDDKPHHALLEYAIREQKLPDVAGRYRKVKDAEPERAARAQKKLDGIVIAATQMLMAMKTPAPTTKAPPWLTLTAFFVSVVLLGWLAWSMFRHAPR